MEQPREQQVPAGPAPYYPYQPQPYPQPSYAAPAPRPSAWRMLATFVRLIVRRLLYVLVLILRPLRAHTLPILIILALLGLNGWMALQLWGPRPAAVADSRVALLPTSPAVENYLTGRRTFNADMMWDAYGANLQSRQLQSGGSKATMKTLATQEQRLGLQYRNVQYIGGVADDEGGHIYYYSIDAIIQGQTLRMPIVFWSDREGKIEYIFTPLDTIIQNRLQ